MHGLTVFFKTRVFAVQKACKLLSPKDLFVPGTLWDKLGTAWDMGQAADE